MGVTASKLATAPDDDNKTQSQANQDAVTVTQSGNTITISGSMNSLNSYASTNPQQGSGKWIGLDMNSGLDSIVGVKWGDSYTMDESDVAEANSVNLPAGHFIFWVKAEDLPRTIKVNDVEYSIVFQEA